MANKFILPCFDGDSSNDLTAKIGYAVKLMTTSTNGTNNVELAGANEAAIGVVESCWENNGPVAVCYAGLTKIRLGGNVTQGAAVKVGTGGKFVTASDTTADDYVIATVLKGGADGDLVPAIINKFVI